MECVEKHVSVAYVAAGEVYDGYEGVMKIIGNLRLAEEHSQEWPILHDAIRESRKNFQSKRTMPDWKNLGDLISQARHSFNPE